MKNVTGENKVWVLSSLANLVLYCCCCCFCCCFSCCLLGLDHRLVTVTGENKLTWVPSQSSQSNQSRVIVCVAPSHLSHACRLTVLITVSGENPYELCRVLFSRSPTRFVVLFCYCLFVFSLTRPWPWFTSLDHRVITVTGEN